MLGLLILVGPCSAALSPLSGFWTPNGEIYRVVELPPPGAGVGVAADPATPAQSSLDLNYSRVRGTVHVVISDAAGGWYIGGDFDQIDGLPFKYIARLNASGRLDTTWQVALNGPVSALVLDGDLLYVGGAFTTANDLSRNHLALIASATGQVSETWGPDVNDTVSSLLVSGDALIVGGQFTQLAGSTRNHLGALDKFTAALSSWDPNLDGAVMVLAQSGDSLFVGGSFSHAGGAAHSNVTTISLASGAPVTAWTQDADQPVRALFVDGARLYVGGDFTQLGGLARAALAAVDISSASFTVTTWNPGADGAVHALAVAGDSLFVGGAFSHIGTSARTHLAAIDTLSGSATSWNPGWSSTAVIRALVWQTNGSHANGVLFAGGDRNDDGGKVYLGGDFSYVGPSTGGGVLIPADPAQPAQDQAGLNGAHIIGTVAAAVGDDLGGWYIGGAFTAIDGVAMANLAHIDGSGALDTGWVPTTDGQVSTLVLEGGVLYIGGAFTQVNGLARSRLAALDTSGVLQPWAPGADGDVFTMTVVAGTLYLGGAFTQVGGLSRSHLAAVDGGGAVLAWKPGAGGDVQAIAAAGTTLYLGGAFTQIGAQARNHVAAINTGGLLQAWDPDANGDVGAISIVGTKIYLGGAFTQVSAQARNHLAAVDNSGALLTWDPNANGAVTALMPLASVVYVGGDFQQIGSLKRARLAAVDAATGLATPWSPEAGATVRTLSRQVNTTYPNGVIYCGGSFASLGGVTRGNLAVLDQSTGQTMAWAPSVDGVVRDMVLSGNAQTLYIGGDFSIASGHARRRLAALDTTTGIGLDWAAGANARVDALALSGDGTSLFVGGEFTELAGRSRDYLAQIQTANGIPTEWHPVLDGAVRTLARSDSALYLGGAFKTAIGQSRERIAMLDLSQLRLTNWRPQINNNEVLSILPDAGRGRVYVGGSFTQVFGAPNSGVVAVDPSSAALLTSWSPGLDGPVDALSLSGDGTRVYLGGRFMHSDGGLSSTPYLVSVSSSSGAVSSDWRPELDGRVRDLVSSVDGTRIYVAGGFLSEALQLRPRIADFTLPAGESAVPVTTVTPPGGIYNKATQADLVLSCDDGSGSGCAATYVTTDGSVPRIAPNLRYTDPIPLTSDLTLRFFSVDKQGNREAERQAGYQIDLVEPTSWATPGSQIYFGPEVQITLQCQDIDANTQITGSGCTDIFYTTDESLPTTSSPRYSGPITLSGTVTLQFFAIDTYGNKEPVHREDYVRNRSGVGGFGPLGWVILAWGIRRRSRISCIRGGQS